METIEKAREILHMIGFIVSVAAILISCMSSIKANLIKMSATYICTAEECKTISGAQKMKMVVCWMKSITPRLFRVVFTEEVLEKIAQNVFDDMRSYAEKYFEQKK